MTAILTEEQAVAVDSLVSANRITHAPVDIGKARRFVTMATTSAKPFWLPSATAPHPVRDNTRPWACSSTPSAREPMRSKRRRDSIGCATRETNCATQLHPSAGPRLTSQQPQLYLFSRMRTRSWIVPTPRKARHPDSVRQPNRGFSWRLTGTHP